MQMLGRQVRIGRPLGIGGLTDATKGPAFAAAAGLLVYPQFAYLEHCEPRRTRAADDRHGRVFLAGRTVAEGEVLSAKRFTAFRDARPADSSPHLAASAAALSQVGV